MIGLGFRFFLRFYICVYFLVVVRSCEFGLSVSVQLIAWKGSSPKSCYQRLGKFNAIMCAKS